MWTVDKSYFMVAEPIAELVKPTCGEGRSRDSSLTAPGSSSRELSVLFILVHLQLICFRTLTSRFSSAYHTPLTTTLSLDTSSSAVSIKSFFNLVL